jgi:hypothetical protein
MWIYVQRTGALFKDDATNLIDIGYSGTGRSKNDPNDHHKANRGPIPRGKYIIRAATDHGPTLLSLPLAPSADNAMGGRSGFYIHGESVASLGTASQGCIVLTETTRLRIAKSDDRNLIVVANLGAPTSIESSSH